MATAIIFAKDIIEKFFGQNTGIKQNMEKIESHPTITICPFLQFLDGNYSYNTKSPTKLLVLFF